MRVRYSISTFVVGVEYELPSLTKHIIPLPPPSALHPPPSSLHSCGSDSSYAICNTTLSGEAGNVTIPGTHVFSQFARVHPLYVCIVAMICFSLTFRTLAYLALRFLHRP